MVCLTGYGDSGDMSNAYVKLSIVSGTLMSFTVNLTKAGSSRVYLV